MEEQQKSLATTAGVTGAGAAAGAVVAVAIGVAVLPATLIGAGVTALTAGILWIVKNSKKSK